MESGVLKVSDRAEFPREALSRSVASRFEQIAGLFPDRLAASSVPDKLTYSQLNTRANRLAHAILALRAPGSEPICLLLTSSIDIPVALMGVIKTGKFCIPLDPANPPARLLAMIRDAGASVLVADDRTYPHARMLADEYGTLDVLNINKLPPRLSDENPAITIAPQDLVYRSYTSGTTGQPKGLNQTHFQLVSSTRDNTDFFSVTPEDRFSHIGSYSFAMLRKTLFDPLLNGASVHLFDTGRHGIARLPHWLVEEEISIYYSTPSLFRAFGSILNTKRIPSVRCVLLGGEPVLRHDVEIYKRHFSRKCVFYNIYGSTETGAIAAYRITQKTAVDEPIVPIGFPIREYAVRLLDEAGNEVPQGAIGEIVISGLHIAPNAADKTTTLTADPNHDRWHFTGDLGRLRSDGALEHMGRKDFQIKIRGYRVEPAGIEAALLEHDSIQAAAVFAVDAPSTDEHVDSEKRLVAYIVADVILSSSELQRFLADMLPSYMIPSLFIPVDHLPLNVAGKIDRNALPAPDWSRKDSRTASRVEPRTAIEEKLAAIWADILKIDTVGVFDNFFYLGGTSITGAQMLAIVRRDMGKTISLAALLQSPTIAHLAILLSKPVPIYPDFSLIAIKPDGTRPPLFCVPGNWGNVIPFFRLAEYLDSEQPLYAFHQQDSEGTPPPTSLQALAADYVRELREVQPHGPYYVAGRSFGGLVAYEIAQQLHTLGEQVGCLILFDSVFPRSRWPQRYLLNFLVRQMPAHLIKVMRTPHTQRREALDEFKAQLKHQQRLFTAKTSALELPHINLAYALHYTAKPYPGPMLYFRLGVDPERNPVHERHWSRAALGGMETVDVPGEHNLMFEEPFVRILAETLNQRLRQAQDTTKMQSS